MIIDGKVISSSSEMVYEGTYLSPININYNYYILQETKSINTIFSLRKIINDNVDGICCDLKDVISPFLRYISHNDYNILSPLHIAMKEHDNITVEYN